MEALAARVVTEPPIASRRHSQLPIGATAVAVIFSFIALAGALAGDPASQAQEAFRHSKSEYKTQPRNAKAGWRFARACFDLADFSTNSAQRADLAEQGIAASRQAIALDPTAAAGHYYLGLNLGQLARTRGISALKLLDEMEREWNRARELDEKFDHAGPDRSLGLLYRDAPSFISIGSRTKAREHLLRAVQLAPDFPENCLDLIETYLKWGNRNEARTELKTLEARLPAARAKFSGPEWAASWADWDQRLDAARQKLGQPARIQSPRH